MRFFRKKMSANLPEISQDTIDIALLNIIKEEAPLTSPRLWINRMEFTSRAAALNAQKRLDRNSWIQQYQLTQFVRGRDDWMLTLWSVTAIDSGVILDTHAYLDMIAKGSGGKFVGWEVSLEAAIRDVDNPDYYPQPCLGYQIPGDKRYMEESRRLGSRLLDRARVTAGSFDAVCGAFENLRTRRSPHALRQGIGVLLGDTLVKDLPLVWMAYREYGGFYPAILGLEKANLYYPENLVAMALDEERELREVVKENVAEAEVY